MLSFKTSLTPTHLMRLSEALPTQDSSPQSRQFPAHIYPPTQLPGTTQDCCGLRRGGLASGPDISSTTEHPKQISGETEAASDTVTFTKGPQQEQAI